MRTNIYRIAFVCAFLPSLAAAQIPNASPAAAALGAYTAQARGFDAVAWNPANLGMPGNPLLSLGIGVLNMGTGLKPVSLNDISPYYGQQLPPAIRASWMQRIQANGGERGTVDGGVTPIALSIGPLALQAGTQMIGSMNLSPGMAEALLFGNDTTPALSPAGSTINVGAFTTGAVSYGLSLPSAPLTHMSIGVTGKYVVGNFLARGGAANGSSLGQDTITAAFPMIVSMGLPAPGDTTSNGKINPMAGKGFGLDLGFAWSNPVFSIGASLQNVMNTFAWDSTQMSTRTLSASFNGNTRTDTVIKSAYGTAPQGLRDSISLAKFKPALNVGGAMALDHNTTLVADVRQQIGDGITNDPKTTLAAGLEWRGIPFIALRGGGAYLTGGWGASGGVGIHLGPYELGLAGVVRSQEGGRHGAITISALTIH